MGACGRHKTQPVFHKAIHLSVQNYHDNGVILEMDQVLYIITGSACIGEPRDALKTAGLFWPQATAKG